MTLKRKPDAMQEELKVAIGLVWGHLNTRQFEEAYMLARGCLAVWPDESRLALMSAYAAVELHLPLDKKTLVLLRNTDCGAWRDLVLRRARASDASRGMRHV